MIYYDDDYYVSINYKFHKIDFKIFFKLIRLHIEDIDNYIILKDMMKIEYINENNIDLYNNYSLISKDMSLYNNINFIPHLHKGD